VVATSALGVSRPMRVGLSSGLLARVLGARWVTAEAFAPRPLECVAAAGVDAVDPGERPCDSCAEGREEPWLAIVSVGDSASADALSVDRSALPVSEFSATAGAGDATAGAAG
jgi:hypothetical protein